MLTEKRKSSRGLLHQEAPRGGDSSFERAIGSTEEAS